MSVEFVFRRHRCRKNENSLFEQITGFIGRRDAANGAGGHLVIMDAPRLFGKALTDVLRLPRHGHQRLMQLRHVWFNSLRRVLSNNHIISSTTLHVRR